MPYSTRPPLYQPRMWTGAPDVVCPRPSKAASFTGWLAATTRPLQSPTTICASEAIAATVTATVRATRWWRPQLPRSRPAA